MKNGDTIKDSILNIFLDIKNYILYNVFKKERVIDKSNYQLTIIDNFNSYDEIRWIKTQYFGEINTSYHWQFCSPESVLFTSDGLYLEQKYNERTTEYWDGNSYNTKYDVGCLTSRNPFYHGLYEFDVILPIGQSLWASVWLTGYESWPPEIDIMESYSDYDCKYDSRLNSNTWFGNYNQSRAKKHLRVKDEDLKRPITFSLIWERDKMEFYMNGFKTRVITNSELLKYFEDKPMYVVMNNAIRENMDADTSQISNFIIKEFRYYVSK